MLVEDERALLQATIFHSGYEKYGDLLHHRGAFLLDGRVEQDMRRGYSFLVERIRDLREVLAGVSTPRVTASSPDALLRAARGGRRVG